MVKFDLKLFNTMEEVRSRIQVCEGKHKQQVCYSTFHDCLTQICFGCKKIRSSIKWQNPYHNMKKPTGTYLK